MDSDDLLRIIHDLLNKNGIKCDLCPGCIYVDRKGSSTLSISVIECESDNN